MSTAKAFDRFIIQAIPGYGVMQAYGATVPSDGDAGYATGCLFLHTDGGAGDALYVNVGDKDSANFDVVDEGSITELADSAVTTAKINDSAVTEAKLGNAVASGISTGPVAAKVIASAQLEALLDGSENTLFAVKEGDVILEVRLIVKTAAGGACTVDVGPDADVDGSTKDADGLLINADANSVGHYTSHDTTYDGADLVDGPFTVQGDGNILITSSSDQSSSSFVGQLVMMYMPA